MFFFNTLSVYDDPPEHLKGNDFKQRIRQRAREDICDIVSWTEVQFHILNFFYLIRTSNISVSGRIVFSRHELLKELYFFASNTLHL